MPRKLPPLPLTQASVTFDQAMWTGASGFDAQDPSSVLNPENYTLVATGANSNLTLRPQSVRWDAGSRSAILTLPWGELVDSPGVRDYAPPVMPQRSVQDGFLEIAATDPERCVVIDASKDIETIAGAIAEAVGSRLGT